MENASSKGQNASFEDWKQDLDTYLSKNNIIIYLRQVQEELNSIGYPSYGECVDHKLELQKCSAGIIRLNQLSIDFKRYKQKIELMYDFMHLLKTKEENIKGSNVTEKKKFAEMEIILYKNIIDLMDFILGKISLMKESFQTRYNLVSRLLAVIQFEFDKS